MGCGVIPVILSLDESIQKLKTEILSQDWSLPQKKIEPLQAAFNCLKNRFSTRKSALDILSMADSVLLYARKRQSQVPPCCIDFLKEAMAHVVNIYEEGKFDPGRDAELCKRMYAKFVRLKEQIAAEKAGLPRPLPQEKESSPGKPAAEPASPDEASSNFVQAETAKIFLPRPAGQITADAETTAKPRSLQPGAMIRPVTMGKMALAIAEERIALVKPLSPKKRTEYIKNNRVPLSDLGSWFNSLSSQMKGPLALIKNSKLKKLNLPLMIPQGFGLEELPNEEAAMLVVVSMGEWHGVIFCREVREATPLLSLNQAKNGDLAGAAGVGEKQELQLLNISQLLKREGFLFLPGQKSAGRKKQPEQVKGWGERAMENKRQNTRVPFKITISLDFPDQRHAECETTDLSLKGVFVLGVTGHQVGENCRVSLQLAGSTSHLTLQMKGKVVRVEENGLAMNFSEMDLDSFFHLKNILYYNSADPDTLDAEFHTQIAAG